MDAASERPMKFRSALEVLIRTAVAAGIDVDLAVE
jgi:hypothetical protein